MALRLIRIRLATLLTAGLLLLPHPGSAGERLQLPFSPSVGSRLHFTIVKTKQRMDGQRLERNLKTTSEAELTLEARNEEGFVYRFEITETTASAPGSSKPRLDRLLSRLAGVTDGVPLVYQADASGAPLRLVNTEEVRRAFRGMLAELQGLVRNLTQEGVVSPVERPSLEANVKNTLGVLATLSDAELGTVVLEEVSLLYAATGGDFSLGEKEAFEIQTRVPLVSRPIQVFGERYIKSVDEETRRAVVGIEAGYDQEQLLAAVAQVRGRLSDAEANGGQGALESELRALGAFEVRESGLHMIDLDSGEPLALRHERTMTIGDKRVIEVLKIRRVHR